jgi:T5SS/PEP-CTERM-associated repeat protein/parallel beta-helix repeat protein
MKKLIYLFLIFNFAPLLTAADKTWDAGGSDDRWLTAANWNNDTLPLSSDRVYLDIAGENILIQSGDSFTVNKIIGPCENAAGTVTLTVTGGSLTNPSYWYIGRENGGTGVLNIQGGTVTTRDLICAAGTGYASQVNISAGLLDITGSASGTGAYFGSDPTAGVTNGFANFSLTGGTLRIARLNSFGNNVLINIAGGQMQITGDYTSIINGYIASGKIIAFNGQGSVYADYDNMNAGMTTVVGMAGIQASIEAAANGATVFVPPGEYDEGQFNINKAITLKSTAGPQETTINLSGNGLCITSSNVTIDGFTIKNQTSALTYLLRIGKSISDVSFPINNFQIQNCLLETSNLTDGITIYSDANDIDIFNCSVYNCINGIVVYGSTDDIAIIDNNIFSNSYGIRILGSANQCRIMSNGIYWNSVAGLTNTTTTSVNAENNFWGHATGPYHVIYNSNGQGNAVSNNVDFQPFFIGCQGDKWHLCPAGDLNNDCKTNFADLAILAGAWLNCNGPECE